MIGPQPAAPARWILATALLVLPSGEIRDRYREELRVELSEIGGGAQVFQASSLLVGSLKLRSAVKDRDLPVESPRPNWRCRIGRHTYLLVQDDNPEMRGRAYYRCARCGKPKDPPTYGPPPPGMLGDGMPSSGAG